MKVILILIFLLSFKSVLSQEIDIKYEQKAFNYFIDSILAVKQDKVKCVFFKETINNKHSELKSPIGFKDYGISDSLGKAIVKDEQTRIDTIDLASMKLFHQKKPGLKIKTWNVKRPKKLSDQNIKVEVFKRYIYIVGFYIVEIKVFSIDMRAHYFIEFDKMNSKVSRWYCAEYYF